MGSFFAWALSFSMASCRRANCLSSVLAQLCLKCYRYFTSQFENEATQFALWCSSFTKALPIVSKLCKHLCTVYSLKCCINNPWPATSAAKTALTAARGMNVSCGIWHNDSRSVKSCRLWGEAFMDPICWSSTSQRLSIGFRCGKMNLLLSLRYRI